MPGFTTRPVIVGTHGIVAAGHYLAATAGFRILERGGNAVDAGVAAGLALEVLKPQSTGIGGEVPILIAPTGGWDGQPVVAVKGQGCAPRAATISWFRQEEIDLIPGDGLLPATVPGAFGAWATALLHFGRLTLADVLEPAIELAEEGFPVYGGLRDSIIHNAEKFAAQWPTSAAVYLPNGKPPALDDLIYQADWARTFKKVVEAERSARVSGREAGIQAGLDYFYKGPVAQALADFAASTEVLDASGRTHRGLLRYEDFASYRTNLEPPVGLDYRGYQVYKCGPWCQGPVFLQQLALLEGFDLAQLGHNSADYLHVLIEAAKLAFADREHYYGDPDFTTVPLDRLLSKEYAAERRFLIDAERASAELRPGDAPVLAVGDVSARPATYRGDTTHVDVVDNEGNLFAATPSGGWIPSSPVVAGVGFPLGTRGQMFSLSPTHPNALKPGKRPRTTLTPSLALRDGQPWLAFGTPGGDQQDQWTLQFFLNVVDFGFDLQAAIDAPTVHSLHFPSSFYPRDAHPNRMVVESRIGPEVRAALAARGHEVVEGGAWAHGQVTAVEFDRRQGVLRGAASPRGMSAYVVGR
ncbi:MAG TPA: gamma-glutamyltransferase family protein [Chloroflexota bacterium]|nr:gamma-glutamyltransferase family protein [Chloroflexota bacterium]